MLMRIYITLLSFLPIALSAQLSLEQLADDVRANAQELQQAASDAARKAPAQELLTAMRAFVKHTDILGNKTVDIPVTNVRSPNGVIRLFTWNVPRDNGTHLYYGLMASKTRKGIDVTEFRDSTAVLADIEEREMYPGKWYGAIYYDLIQTKRGGKVYYTLLGWKGYNRAENQKVIEVISITGRRVRLGAPLFEDSPHARKKRFRKVYRYGAQLKMNLSKDQQGNRIIMDHLAPNRPDLADQFAFYGPDLSYDAFSWDGQGWFFERDIDAKGNVNDSKLWNKPGKPVIKP